MPPPINNQASEDQEPGPSGTTAGTPSVISELFEKLDHLTQQMQQQQIQAQTANQQMWEHIQQQIRGLQHQPSPQTSATVQIAPSESQPNSQPDRTEQTSEPSVQVITADQPASSHTNLPETPQVAPAQATAAVQPQVSCRPHVNVQLGKFSGKESAILWWTQFMAFIQLTKISESEAISSLLFYFTGVAQIWFANLDETLKQSLETLKGAFMTRFKPSSKLNMNLMDVEQGPYESVEDYIHRVMTATSDRTVSSDWLIHVVTQGLREKIQYAVIQRDPQTMDDLRDAAQKAETSEKLIQKKRAKELEIQAVNKVSWTQENGGTHGQQSGSRQCGRCGRSCGSLNFCRAKDNLCYFCNKQHHFWKQCRIRKEVMRNGGSGELKYKPKGQINAST
ncbi:hypothetical protein FSP39_013247 [Pinctada imbricata]|uniref:CCHC-type domain-containing protein n=1 Tax=Pinctada imbricata TaxID=66713 RepID=A0AA89BRX3_PINIB|nr:hypothetical protein FSP39_013247 [Pinctada imbricata]